MLRLPETKLKDIFVGTIKGKPAHPAYKLNAIRAIGRRWHRELLSKGCQVCGYAKHTELAHILSVASFSDDATLGEVNNKANVFALCPNHHWEFDNFQLDKNAFELLQQRTSIQLQFRKSLIQNLCSVCSQVIRKESKMCRTCSGRAQIQTKKIVWPNLIALLESIKLIGFVALGKQLGVSDNAIRKHLRRKGYNPKTLMPNTGADPVLLA